MKKSTILLVLFVYLVSFFIIGFIGISVQSAYSLVYVKEIKISALPDQPTVVLTLKDRKENTGIDDNFTTYTNTYDCRFNYVVGGTNIVKFSVDIDPVESTYKKFTLVDTLENDRVTYEVKDDTYIYVTFTKKYAAEFIVQSTDGNKTESKVTIRPM